MNRKAYRLLCFLIALAMLLTGCGSRAEHSESSQADAAEDAETERSNPFAPLDREKIATETSEFKARAAYYKEYVDDVVDGMTDEEQDAFFVTVNVVYEGEDILYGDILCFFRNDDVYEGDVRTPSKITAVVPGIYSIISVDADDDHSNFGEIELLVPGEEVTMIVDYDACTATLQRS